MLQSMRCKESDLTERLNNNENYHVRALLSSHIPLQEAHAIIALIKLALVL